MQIFYFLLILIAIVFKLFHFPGYSIILLFSPIIAIVDLIIQIVRKRSDKVLRIWSSAFLLAFSFFFLFKLLRWPLANFIFVPTFILFIVFIVKWFQFKGSKSFRYVLTTFLFLFGVFNLTLNGSKLMTFYALEDPFNPNELYNPVHRHFLAYEFYKEGEFKKSEILLKINLKFFINERNNLRKYQEGIDPIIIDLNNRNIKNTVIDLNLVTDKKWIYPSEILVLN